MIFILPMIPMLMFVYSDKQLYAFAFKQDYRNLIVPTQTCCQYNELTFWQSDSLVLGNTLNNCLRLFIIV